MSFNFNPAAGETESSSAVDLRRQLAAAMMQQGMQSTPIQSPWQGVARLSEALMGGLAARRQAQQEQAANSQLMAAMTGQPYTPPAQSSGFLSKLFGDNSVPASGAQSEMATSSPATTTAVAPGTANDIQNQFLDTVKGGYDVGGQKLAVTNPYGLAAIAATGKAESGWSPQNAGSTWNDGKNNAGGIMSWNGPRLANLQKFAGGTNGTPQQQGQFFLQENPQLISALNNAKSVTEAQNIMNNAWAFKGYNEPGNANAAHRLALANGYLPQFAQAGASTAPVSAPTPIAAPAAGPTQVASLDPSAGMPVGNAPNPVGTAVPPPSPTAQPSNMATVSPDQMQAMLGPQPTPGYRDPMVTTAYREPVPATPAAQAINQQIAPAGADPMQTASLGPTNGQAAAAAIPSDATAGALPPGQQVPIPSPSPVGGLPAAAPAQEAPRARLAQAMQSAPPQAPNVLANSPRAQALMQAMMNPNASPQVRQMAGVMFQNEMGKGQALYQAQMEQYIKQQDPQYQATLAKAQYEAAHLGQVSPDTAATLQAQREKPIDVNGHLVTNDGKEVADFSNPNVSTVGNALIDQKTGKVIYQGTPNAEKIQPGESLVNPQTGSVVFQGTGYKPSDVHDMRKEFESLPNYKAYQSAAPVYKAMIDTAGTDSKASDLNLVYGLGKIMDPNSVVREGEMVMVNNTSSLPDWLAGAINAVNGGSRLEPATRTAILNEAKNRISSYRSVLDNDVNQYRGIAQRRGMNPDDILPTLSDIAEVPKLDGSTPSAPMQIKGVDDYQALPSGTQYLDPNGVLRTKQ